MGKVSGKETLPYDTNGENNSKSEVKKMQREQKTNVSTSSDFLEDEKRIHCSPSVCKPVVVRCGETSRLLEGR